MFFFLNIFQKAVSVKSPIPAKPKILSTILKQQKFGFLVIISFNETSSKSINILQSTL